MKIIKTIFAITGMLLFTSCVSYISMYEARNRIKDLEIGMTKNQVIAIMGNTYELVSSSERSFTLGYVTYDGAIYKFIFRDGKLEKWEKEYLPYNHTSTARNQFTVDTRSTSSNNLSTKANRDAMKIHLDAHRNAMKNAAGSESDKQHIDLHMDAHEKAVLGH